MANDQAISGSDGTVNVTVDSRPANAGISAIEARMMAFSAFVSRTSATMANSFNRFNAAVAGAAGGGMGGGAGGGVNGLTNAMGRFGPVASSFMKLVTGASSALLGFMAIKGIIALMEGFISRMIEVNRVYTGFIASMSIVRGSTAAASKEYEFLLAISNRLGVQVETSITQYHRLAAALKNVDTTGELARHIFSGLSQAAVVLHSRGRDVTLIFEAVQQMASKGKLSLEELQRQLGNTLPGAMGIAARAMMESQSFMAAGVKTAAESERMLRKGIEKGTINVYEFLLRLSNQLKKEYGAGVEYASNQFTANFNRMKNAVFEFYRMVGSSGAMEGLTKLIREITALFNDGADEGSFGMGKALGEVFTDMAKWVEDLDADDVREFFETVQVAIGVTSTVVTDFFSVFSGFGSGEIQDPLLGFVEFVGKTMATVVDIFAVAVAGVEMVVRAFIAAFNDLRELAYGMSDIGLDISENLYGALPDSFPGIAAGRQNIADQQTSRRAREQSRTDNAAAFDRSFNAFVYGPDQTTFDRVSGQFAGAREQLAANRTPAEKPWTNFTDNLTPFDMTSYKPKPSRGGKAGSSADDAAKYVNPLGDAELQKLLEQVQANSGAPNAGKTPKTPKAKSDPVENNFLRETTRLTKGLAVAEVELQNVMANRNLSEGENVAQMRSLIATDERYIKLSSDKKGKLMDLAKQLDDMNLKLINTKKSQEAFNQALQAEFDVSTRLSELKTSGFESQYRRTSDVENSFKPGGENEFMDEANQQRTLSAAMREDAAQRNLDMARYVIEIQRSNEEMIFQADLVGMSKLEAQKMTEYRKIDLEIQKLMVGATQAQQIEYLKLAEILKTNVAGALEEVQAKQEDLWRGLKQGFHDYVDSVSDRSSEMADITKSAFSGMEDAFVSFVETGKLSFEDLVRSIAKDLVKLIVRYLLVWFLQKMTGLGGGYSDSGGSGSLQGLGDFSLPTQTGGFAKGGAFNNGIQTFAKGGVFSQPFSFPMQGGKTGVGAEAGDEAIMPLARDTSGSLGVKVVGGNTDGGDIVPITLNVEIYQGKGDGVKTEQGQNEKGDVLKIFIGEVAADVQRGGPVGKAITSTYGISRKPRSYV